MDGKNLLTGVVGSLIATGLAALIIWATDNWPSKYWSLWLTGIGGFLVGLLVLYWWQLRKRIRFSPRIEGSPFEFHKLASAAQHSIQAIGPTLIFLTQNPAIRQLLFKKLTDPKFRISFLISDPDSGATQLWNQIAYGRDFNIQLRESIAAFQSWLDPKERPNLTIKTVSSISASLVFIDADHRNGQLIIIPLPWGVSGQNRPCFRLSKSFHPIAFNTYYDSYRALLSSETAKSVSTAVGKQT